MMNMKLLAVVIPPYIYLISIKALSNSNSYRPIKLIERINLMKMHYRVQTISVTHEV